MTQRNLPKMPRFESEAEEAQWIFDHREELGKDIPAAAKNGTLGEGSLARGARKLREREAQERHSAA